MRSPWPGGPRGGGWPLPARPWHSPPSRAPARTTDRAAATAQAGSDPTGRWRYPGADWQRVAPGDAGFDAAGLRQLAEQAEAAGSSCLVVTRDGVVVDEHVWGPEPATTPRQAFSVTKSVTSTLVGIAAGDGVLSLDDPVSRYVPEWRGTASEAVTIEDLLSNSSGRHWDLATDHGQMVLGADDKTAFAIGLGRDCRAPR